MRLLTILAGAIALGAATAPVTAKQFVLNGGFEITTLTASSQISDYFVGNPVTGWTTTGYNFLFFPGTATTTGAVNQYTGQLTFHGPANGSANGYTDSPTGGNYIANDGAYIVAPLNQTLTGLRVGNTYTVAFDWAAAQQTGFAGPTTEQWVVSLGTESHATAVWSNPDHGFRPWSHETMTFTATAASEVLSFLAVGTPEGRPPFSLLDGVSANGSVPEAATWAMMIGGLGLVGGALRLRRRSPATLAA